MIYDNYKFGVIFLLIRKRICQFNCYSALPPTVFYIQSVATLRMKMKENAFLLGLVLCGWSFDIANTQGVSVDPYCNKNDLELPQHAKRWHCSNPLATDHSKIPIGDKCELICKDNYRLYKSNCSKEKKYRKFNLCSVSNRSRQRCVADGQGNGYWQRMDRVRLQCLPDCKFRCLRVVQYRPKHSK